ncbi:serine hydrolase domain-containing protein [Acuticoccus yangtzensis]|uniref:serine hydrolase domain-containing protein n=1 Tax=Acuticoccus yangtzensis TaxID=1443441 RepID=UPI000A55DD25|nr:serine hydrolase domain-containing protein [Acuticoccus yangtzensis]
MIRTSGALMLIVGALAFGGPPAAADPLPVVSPEAAGLSAERLAMAGAKLEADIAAGTIPGAVLTVLRGGKVAYQKAFGIADGRAGTPMAEDSIFRIYSMTKPVTSLVVMQLVEEGRILLTDPVSKYIPSFADPVIGVEGVDEAGDPVLADEIPAAREPTIHDLLRHTAGLVYGATGRGAVRDIYFDTEITRAIMPNREMAKTIGEAPLAFEPGTGWEYGRATDVLGAIIEEVEGRPLSEVFEARVFGPLGMVDTAFWVEDEADRARVAQPADSPLGGREFMLKADRKPSFESGGNGLFSTAPDYARFTAMLMNGGTLDGVRIIGERTLAFMTSDHLGAIPHGAPEGVKSLGYLPGPGYGFGLGFAVRLAEGEAPFPGSPGDYFWGGGGGTYFWVDPAQDLAAIFMLQGARQGQHYRPLLRSMIYAAITGMPAD